MSMKFPILNKQNRNEKIKTPTHVAIIMDGNGRWAKKRGLPRVAGHKKGMDVVKETVKMAIKCHVKILTLYAFSTENWKRPKAEVDFLMRLPNEFLDVCLPDLIKNNVCIDTIGNPNILPEDTQKAIAYAKEKTKQYNGLLLNLRLTMEVEMKLSKRQKVL